MSNINIEKELQSILDYEGDVIHHNTFNNIVGLVRLYAESVIGEDEKMYNPPYQTSSQKAVRNLLRAEQRKKING